MDNEKLSQWVREHLSIMLKHINEAENDADAVGSIINAAVFMIREYGEDPVAWATQVNEIYDKVKADRAARMRH